MSSHEVPGPVRSLMEAAVDELLLLTQARSGNQDAFRTLWSSVERQVFGMCLYLTGSHADALDAAQETQIAVWRNLDRFEGRCTFAAWVSAIGRNAALTVIRRRGGREDSLDDAGDVVDDRPLFDEVVADLVDLRQALDTLSPAHREALLLWAGGLTYQQVAASLGAPLNTVKVWIHRARQHLRQLLTD